MWGLWLAGCIANEIVVRNVGVDTAELPDDDDDDDGELPPDPGTRQTLAAFSEPCTTPGELAPVAGEEGHLVATVLSPPPGSDFVVTDVTAVLSTTPLSSGETCDAGLPQQLQIWAWDGTSPPVQAAPDAVLEFPAASPSGSTRVVAGAIDPPLLVTAGEVVVVGLKYAGSWPDVPCVQTCAGDASTSWWSNAAVAPYDWVRLSDLGFGRAPNLTASGYTGP